MQEREAELERGWQQLKDKEDKVVQLDKEVALKLEKLEQEKMTMTKIGTGPNDIIGLNLGGEKTVQVKRSLLLQFEESMLASMFSGRHDDTLDRDKDGNVFLDYGPKLMCCLIDYLRLRRDLAPNLVFHPQIPPQEELAWAAMLDFFGLKDIFFDIISRQPTIFRGIAVNIPISALRGWTLVVSEPFNKKATMANFVPPLDELDGGSLLLGLRVSGKDMLCAAVVGNVDSVRKWTTPFWMGFPLKDGFKFEKVVFASPYTLPKAY